MSVATPHLREDLLAPRVYTTEVTKAARTDLDRQRETFDRRACLSRLAELTAEERKNRRCCSTPWAGPGLTIARPCRRESGGCGSERPSQPWINPRGQTRHSRHNASALS